MKDETADVENPKVVTTDYSSSKRVLQTKRRLPVPDRLRGLLLSVSLQSALQIAAGTFVACLFTFVRAISFPQSCVVATLFLVVSVMSSPNNHLGTRINAAASLVGSDWIGAIPAAVVATLAKLPGPGPASTGIYVALGAVAIAVLSINRVGSNPPMLWSLGMTSCLAFGLFALSTWKLQTIVQVWSITGYLILVSVIAAVVSTLAAALVMPTLATERVQAVLTDVLQSAGLSTSRHAARLFRARPAQQTSLQQQSSQLPEEQREDAAIYSGLSAAALGRRHSPDGHIEVSMDEGSQGLKNADSMYALGDACAAFVMEDTMTEGEWLQLIQRNSSPNPSENPKAYRCPFPEAGVGMLRPKLAEVQSLLLPAASVEPPWLRVPSLLSCGGSTHWFDAAAWGKVVGALQVLITRLSALEAVIEDGEVLHESGGWISSPELLSCLRLVYSQTATSLALMASTVKQQGRPTAATAQDKSDDGNFCVMVGAFGVGWLRAKEELTAFMKAHTELYWERMMAAAPGSPVTLPSLTNVRHLMFSWVLTNSIVTATEQLERALAAAVCNAPPIRSSHRMLGWLVPLWPLLSGRYLFANWYKVLLVDFPAVVVQGSAGFSRLLSQPVFQAGVKYWAVLVVVYTATIIAMHYDSAIATLTPAFGYVAAVLTMSERVEATVSKVSFWFAGTIVGGGLGCLAMWHPAVATNPYALMAIMVAAAFLVGLLGHTRGRVAITLTLMTLSALILCQYNGVRPGRLEVAAARVVSVLAGVLLAVLVCNMVLPWYTSTWAIETMCHVYEHSVQLLCELVAKSYQQGAESVALAAQHHSQGPTHAVEIATDLAATLAAAAAESFPDAAACSQARDPGDPAALQLQIARPLVAVQVSLMRDTVAWQKGVLATPPIVRELLKSLQSLADRLAALQLALKPPKVTGVMTGAHMLYFGVPLRDQFVHLFELHGILAAAVAAAVQHPESRTHANAIRVLVKSIEQQRVSMYRTMTQLRRDLHVRALQQQDLRAAAEAYAVAAADEDCPTAQKASQCMRAQLTQYFGTADDAVAYLGFQFALLKAVDKAAAVAKLVLADFC